MDEFNIEKEINNKFITIYFKYIGTINNTINTDEIKLLINNLIEYYCKNDCIFADAISNIKTILKDTNEKELIFKYTFRDDIEMIKYKDSEIVEYINSNDSYSISYNNGNFTINKISDSKSLLSLSNSIINKIKVLKNINPSNDAYEEIKSKIYVKLK